MLAAFRPQQRLKERRCDVRPACLTFGLTLIIAGLLTTGPLAQTQLNPHIGHVMTRFGNTPDSQGLLPTAMAEAKVAAQHAALAAQSPDNLSAMKLHAGHVLHAVAPRGDEGGPGLGYGVKRAAEGVVQHIGLAAGGDGASDNIKTHAQHVTASAKTVVMRVDVIVELVQEIRGASTAGVAAEAAAKLDAVVAALTTGEDANGDGRVGWQEGEGGLDQAQRHMELMVRGEGG
jgi:hypothetical protein